MSSEQGDESTWTRHVSGRLRANAVDGTSPRGCGSRRHSRRAARSRSTGRIRHEGLSGIRAGDGEALASVAFAALAGSRGRRAMFDVCGQLMLAALPAGGPDRQSARDRLRAVRYPRRSRHLRPRPQRDSAATTKRLALRSSATSNSSTPVAVLSRPLPACGWRRSIRTLSRTQDAPATGRTR